MIPGMKTSHDHPSLSKSQQTLPQVLADLRAILENATIGILFTRNRMLVRGNPVFAQMFGYDEQAFVGLPGRALYPSDAAYEMIGNEAGPVLAAGQPFSTETQMLRSDGSLFWCRLSAKAVDPHRPQDGTIWITEDITEERAVREALQDAHDELERRVIERTAELSAANAKLQAEVFERMHAEQRVWHLAHHDALTGLPNRALLQDRLQQAMAQAGRGQHRLAVMFLDLDRFKAVNDTLGHEVGDAMLKEVANRLREAVRASDTVARLGGDEFVVVLHEIAAAGDAARVAEKIIASFVPPAQLGEHSLQISTSIGIGLYPEDSDDAYALMKCADTAMYRAKHGGRNRFRFFSTHTAGIGDRLGLIEERLATALAKQRFSLAWQPVIDLEKRSTGSIEALLRWHDPDAGLISPAEFIPLAEEAELFPAIGSWVLEQALLQNRRWQLSGRPQVTVAVNLSARQMRQKDIAAVVLTALQQTGHPAHLLELEIPETALLHDFVSMRRHLSELAAMGVRLTIDDFGTGELGLLALRSLPVQRLKLAARLIAFHEETRLIPAIIGMAKGLGLDVVAKGVENADQCATLRGLGCRFFQGHHFSQPLPADAEALLFFSSERIKI